MLNIKKYMEKASMWPMLKRYLLDSGKFDITSSDDDLYAYIKRCATISFGNEAEADTFRKAIERLKNGEQFTMGRLNQLRLCFALRLKNQNEVDNLFCNYLHVNALSARNLLEFIALCGINCGMCWNEVLQLIEKYRAEIEKQASAPRQMRTGQTRIFIGDTVPQIKTKEKLEAYLGDSRNLTFFAKTRNTHYMALFYDCTPYLNKQKKVCFADDGRVGTRKISMKDCYERLFGIHSNEEESYHNYLTDKEIAALIPIFPDTFMTYATFRDLVQRRRTEDIGSGTYFLHIVETLTSYAEADDDLSETDYTDMNKMRLVLDNTAVQGEFPKLNRESNSFDALLLDVLEETIQNNPGKSSKEMKNEYLHNLRDYLKKIAACTVSGKTVPLEEI